ncbi:MAG: TolC family protein, partial [Planctomycetes bacterium]|nr:TolC family protein [Planctomycetota bacterium]
MRWASIALVTALSGCHVYTLDVDGRLVERASQPVDVRPEPPAMLPRSVGASFGKPNIGAPISPAEYQTEKPPAGKEKKGDLWQRLTQYTKDIPGGEVAEFNIPAKGAEREAAIKKQFPPLTKVPPLPLAQFGPDGRPLPLTELQQLALRNHPLIRQAYLDVEAMRGIARQAGAYPNPTIGYEASSIGQGDMNSQRSPGQQGGFFEQTIVTMGKLKLAREAALRDVAIGEQRTLQVESDVRSQVRANYFAVLSAQKNFEIHRSLSQLTDELYQVLLAQLIAGEVAAYEPMQTRVLANQARNALLQSRIRYQTAWKQLAASLGMPTLPLTAVSGQIDMPVPYLEHDKVLEHVLSRHTDIVSATFGVEKARLLARLAEVQPYPDLTVHVAFQKDYTTPPFGSVANVNVGVPFPLWHRNQGGIQAANALLRRSLDDNQRLRNELTSKVAEAFERYENNRRVLDMYKKEILPNQVQAYRAAVARHSAGDKEKVTFNDLVNSQQTLAGLITNYLGALSDQWTAVVDIANLMQTRDLFQTQAVDDVAPIPDVEEIHRGGWL